MSLTNNGARLIYDEYEHSAEEGADRQTDSEIGVVCLSNNRWNDGEMYGRQCKRPCFLEWQRNGRSVCFVVLLAVYPGMRKTPKQPQQKKKKQKEALQAILIIISFVFSSAAAALSRCAAPYLFAFLFSLPSIVSPM